MFKKIFCLAFTVLMAISVLTIPVEAANYDSKTDSALNLDLDLDYLGEMKNCAKNGGSIALEYGAKYEEMRNQKIDYLGLSNSVEKTHFFSTYTYGNEILIAIRAYQLKSSYPVAAEVYKYLALRGYSDAVIAGILGNMMVECGGQTLNLHWNSYGSGSKYYGICQWSTKYNPCIKNTDLNYQLEYLYSSMEYSINSSKGDYNYFCSLKDAGDAARYFCNKYERAGTPDKRARLAKTALEWLNTYNI